MKVSEIFICAQGIADFELSAAADGFQASQVPAIRNPQSAIPFGVRIAAVYIPQPHGRCAAGVTIAAFSDFSLGNFGNEWH
jgi:hypothetical protein